MPVLGFRTGDFTYITDANRIPEEAVSVIRGTKILVINALQKESHPTHFTISQALEEINKLEPETAYLTHISHNLGLHEEVSKELPKNVFLAYDGLKVTF
jgi:phosphoribosyl 1,2-cyclic phosphate phosphodiesterase